MLQDIILTDNMLYLRITDLKSQTNNTQVDMQLKFIFVQRIGIKSLTLRLLMSYIYGTPVLDVSRSHTTT